MATTSDDSPVPDLEQVERALRPLRRVLARRSAQRATDPAAFQRSCRRLADPLVALDLPAPLRAEVDELLHALNDADGWPTAWQAVVRLDEQLGLPLRLPRPRRRGTVVQPADDEASDGGARDGSSGRSSRSSRRRRKRKGKGRGRSGSAESTSAPKGRVAPAKKPERLTVRRWDDKLAELVLDPALVAAAAQAGVETVADALLRAPLRTTRIAPIHGAGRPLPAGEVAIGGRVSRRHTVLRPDGTRESRVALVGAGPVEVVWDPDAPLLVTGPRPGDKAVVRAVVGDDGVPRGGAWMTASDGEARRHHRHADPSVDEAWRVIVQHLLPQVDRLDDPLPASVRQVARVVSLAEAARGLAVRGADDPLAARRLKFDQLFAWQLGRSFGRFDPGAGVRGIPHAVSHKAVVTLEVDGRLGLPSQLVAKALEDVKRDLRDARPMRRLVVGDDPAPIDDLMLRTMLLVASSSAQVMVIGPDVPSTQLLHDRFGPLLQACGLSTARLDAEPSTHDRERLRSGGLDVVFGPFGLLDPSVELRRLGLVVAIEQTELGTPSARARLGRRPVPDLLTVVRGQVDAGTLGRAHPTADVVRFRVRATAPRSTRWSETAREEAWRALAQDVGEGFAGVVAFPMRRGGADLMGRREAEQLAESLGRQVFGSEPLGVLHGAMTRAERERVWQRLRFGDLPAVVATVPVEFLPPLERPTAILVEHADRMDLARVLSLRTLASSAGRMHLVAGETPEPGPTAALDAMVDRKSDLDVLAAHPGALTVGELPDDLTCPAVVTDAPVDLVDGSRRAAHAVLRADPALTSPSHGLMVRWATDGWSTLGIDGSPSCPLPRVRSSSGTSRRRRRRRRR